jgi:hypothetical protein
MARLSPLGNISKNLKFSVESFNYTTSEESYISRDFHVDIGAMMSSLCSAGTRRAYSLQLSYRLQLMTGTVLT